MWTEDMTSPSSVVAMTLQEDGEFQCCIQLLPFSLRAIIHQCHCHDNKVSFSDCYHENGKNYRGMVRKTRKGITCQKWNVNTPHRTKYDVDLMLSFKQFLGTSMTPLVAFILQLCPKIILHTDSIIKQALSRLCD